MIVGLIQSDFSSKGWNGLDFEYADFLAQQLTRASSSAIVELDFDKQLEAATILKKHQPKDKEFKRRDNTETRGELLFRSQIWEIYTSDALVLDIKLHCEKDLEKLVQWAGAVCSLNKFAVNSQSCPCSFLNYTKQVYAVITVGEGCREQFQFSIKAILKRIGLIRTTFFFRTFQPMTRASEIPAPLSPQEIFY
ncbi:MAG: hypothetical protein AB8B94_04255 [Hyphomicrobiales bacterium]